ncbi:MAG: hypothetical protein P4L74_00780 [Candidatus Doudnabacteria bacterium]|nr:hypothetical protein [Candidatus Doudnabacteria bacterium]
MVWINKQKLFNRYLPMFLSVLLIVAAVFAYLIFRPQTPVAEAAPAFVSGQSNGCITGSGTCNAAFPSANTAHNFLVAECEVAGGNTCALTDTQSNTWVQATTTTDGTYQLYVFYVVDAKAGANTVTMTASGSTFYQTLAFAEFSGIINSSPLDQAGSGINTSTTNWTATAGGITANANELLIGAGGMLDSVHAGSGFSAGSLYTIAAGDSPSLSSAGNGASYLEYRIVSATGTYSAPATSANAESGPSLIVTFKGISAKTGNFVQQGGKFVQRGGKVTIGK